MSFDYGWITRTIDEYMMGFGDSFIAVANVEAFWIAGIILMIYAVRWAYTGERDISFGLAQFLAKFLFVEFAIHYYATPMPGMHSSFKTFIPDLATDLANAISGSRFDLAMSRIIYIVDHLQQPDTLNPAKAFIAGCWYWMISVNMIALGVILLLPIGLGFIILGMGAVIWPICIPWILVPRLSHLFWNSLQFIIKFSFYRVFAASLTFVWAGICVLAVDHLIFPDINGQMYSLAQFSGSVLIAFGFMNVLCLWTVFGLPGVVSDFFSGGSGSGRMSLRIF